jgi:hypothetical protein
MARARITKRAIVSTDTMEIKHDSIVAKENRARYIKRVLSADFGSFVRMEMAKTL